MRRTILPLLIACTVVLSVLGVMPATAQSKAPVVAVVTPYLAQPGTQFMVEAFQAYGKDKGWTVNVIDTAGDIANTVSRLEDVAGQGVDAIVINVDPSQVSAGLQAAKKANIPVFGMDAGTDPLLVTNVTSNGYEIAAKTATYVVDRIGGKGNIVMLTFDAYPPVQKRGIVAKAIFGNYPDIKIIDTITPDVQDGGIADSRAKMEAVLTANPTAGSISAVWAAWDQPALGAQQAIEAAGRQKEGIVIVGADANPQALDAISKGSNFEASAAQDFTTMGKTVGDEVTAYLNKQKITQSVIYVPTTLVTSANVASFIKK